MTLTIGKDVIVQVPVVVLRLAWNTALVDGLLAGLPCTACRKPLGCKPWALAWIKDDEGRERGARLCEACGKRAEAPA